MKSYHEISLGDQDPVTLHFTGLPLGGRHSVFPQAPPRSVLPSVPAWSKSSGKTGGTPGPSVWITSRSKNRPAELRVERKEARVRRLDPALTAECALSVKMGDGVRPQITGESHGTLFQVMDDSTRTCTC